MSRNSNSKVIACVLLVLIGMEAQSSSSESAFPGSECLGQIYLTRTRRDVSRARGPVSFASYSHL
jgi:hypothetical protein